MTAIRCRNGIAGFTLLEMLVAVTLMGMILTALGMITAQWLPSWNRGFMRVQRGELFSVALNRLASDLSSAELVTPNRDAKQPIFDGTPTSVILVRSAIGPNTEPGLEVVRIAEARDRQGAALVRTRTRFAPFGSGEVPADQLSFADPVVLLRAPFQVTFSYSSGDGRWHDNWRGQNQLPAAIRFLVRDTTSGRTLAISSATMVHVDLPAGCAGTGGAAGAGAPGPGGSQTSGAPQVAGAQMAGAQVAGGSQVPGGSGGCGSGGGAARPNAPGAPSNGSVQGQ